MARKKQTGGYLKGPSHKNGGIAAVVGGQEPVELEGGEYIIKKSSVDKIGKENLARINEEGRIPNMATGGAAQDALSAAHWKKLQILGGQPIRALSKIQ